MADSGGAAAPSVAWVTPAGRLSSEVNSPNGRELFRWRHQLAAAPAGGVSYTVVAGELPGGLTLDAATGLIDGTLTEMDGYVDGWDEALDSYDTPDTTGGRYATVGSAAAQTRVFPFTVRATLLANPAIFADRAFDILVCNNYSSDRDRFVREHPSLGPEKEAELRAAGYLPPLSNA
jgi:hypothetical protein